jgi:hypothetical protein
MNKAPDWRDHFRIESATELDFVLGENFGWTIGLQRESPAEFKRRIVAASISYQLNLKSVDYVMKKYVDDDLFENEEYYLGTKISKILKEAISFSQIKLPEMHSRDKSTIGLIGSDISMFRIPPMLDSARLLANRGMLLETLPILRLCLEMLAWACRASRLEEERDVFNLKAQQCIPYLKNIYSTSGLIYGYLSKFTHWGHSIHGVFLNFEEDKAGIIYASVKYRAISLSLIVLLVDIFVASLSHIYGPRSREIALGIQGLAPDGPKRNMLQAFEQIRSLCRISEMDEINRFFVEKTET